MTHGDYVFYESAMLGCGVIGFFVGVLVTSAIGRFFRPRRAE